MESLCSNLISRCLRVSVAKRQSLHSCESKAEKFFFWVLSVPIAGSDIIPNLTNSISISADCLRGVKYASSGFSLRSGDTD